MIFYRLPTTMGFFQKKTPKSNSARVYILFNHSFPEIKLMVSSYKRQQKVPVFTLECAATLW